MSKPTIIYGDVAVDDRGYVTFVNDFHFKNVRRFYQVENHRAGFIRAWHGHYNEGKYIFVPKGAALVAAIPIEYFLDHDMPGVGMIPGTKLWDEKRTFQRVLSNRKPAIIYVPPGFANGFKTLAPDTIVQFYSTSTLEDSKDDDIRFDWDAINIWEEEYK